MMKEAIGYHQVFGDILRGMEMIEKKKQGRCDCTKMPEAGIASSFPKIFKDVQSGKRA
jgi:cyclophilin family peptidyl-prolyl cis-trans isomerase